MASNRKSVIALFSIALLLVGLIFFIFSRGGQSPLPDFESEPCLMYQGEDVSKPCFFDGAVTSLSPSSSSSTEDPGTAPSVRSAEISRDVQALSSCTSSISIERDECIQNAAVLNNSSSLCFAIKAGWARSECLASMGREEERPREIFSAATKSYDFGSDIAVSPLSPTLSPFRSSLSSIWSDTIARLAEAYRSARDNPDPRFTAEGYFARASANAPLSLYALSEYQASPGTQMLAYGSGFSKTGNTLYIGGQAIPDLSSPDGATLTFVAPSMQNGEYEAWVEVRGLSSKVETRPIKVVITDNPAPRPTITAVSPVSPKSTDVLVLSGANLGSSVTVITTFGVVSNVSASGSSFSLRLSDLPYYKDAKDAPGVKGKKVSFFVYAQNESGISNPAFVFDIQF